MCLLHFYLIEQAFSGVNFLFLFLMLTDYDCCPLSQANPNVEEHYICFTCVDGADKELQYFPLLYLFIIENLMQLSFFSFINCQ